MLRLLAPVGAVLLLVSSVAMAAEPLAPARAQALLFDAASWVGQT